MASPTVLKLNKLPPTMVMHVIVQKTRQFRLRRWLALNLIHLATLILGCSYEQSEACPEEGQ